MSFLLGWRSAFLCQVLDDKTICMDVDNADLVPHGKTHDSSASSDRSPGGDGLMTLNELLNQKAMFLIHRNELVICPSLRVVRAPAIDELHGEVRHHRATEFHQEDPTVSR